MRSYRCLIATLMVACLLLCLAPAGVEARGTSHSRSVFWDVPDDFWAVEAITACAGAGIVQGYWDGSYRPSRPVTRDQMAVYVARTLAGGDGNVPSGPTEATFSDVDQGHWAYRYIEYCAAHEMVQGYPGGAYRPDQAVNRGQMAVYIARARAGSDASVPPAAYGPTFPDVTDDSDWAWCYRYTEYCADHSIVQGYSDGRYHPERPVTRDQMAVYVARAFGLLKKGRLAGYLPDYRLSTLGSIDFSVLTNLVYFGLDADTSGHLHAGPEYLSGLPDVVSTAHAAGVKVSACVGRWLSDSYFVPLARSDSARATFIAELVQFCLDNGLDGVDLDWEPVADADVPYYATLISESHSALDPYGLLLSVAVSSGHHDIPVSSAYALSWVGVMAYDMGGPNGEHSSYGDTVAAMQYWTDYGFAESQLLMGVPFYGRNATWSAITYAEIVDSFNPAPDENWAGGYFFNGIDLVREKASYVAEQGFGGVMVWELGQDEFDSRSLLAVLADQIGEGRPPAYLTP